jgi:PHD/YefM family antitoxin component YafN of YafNO toxin-antitoxin module
MIHAEDIYSLTSFQRDAKSHLKRLRKTQRAEILTVNGKAAAVVQDPKSYQKMLDAIDRAEAIEGIREGLESMREGRGIPLEELVARFWKKYKFLQ